MLILDVPEGWVLLAGGPDVHTLAPGSAPADLVLHHGPIIPRPDDEGGWMEATLRADAPAHDQLRVVSTRTERTATGWPLHVVDAELVARDDGVREVRLAGFYRFLEYAACVVVRATAPEVLAARRPAILEILRSARPSWSDTQVVCLRDLFP
jgi:hypothetical protein